MPDTDNPDQSASESSGSPARESAGHRPRLKYLEAMGVDIWSRRESADDATTVHAEPEQVVSSVAVASERDAKDQPDTVTAETAVAIASTESNEDVVSVERPAKPAVAPVASPTETDVDVVDDDAIVAREADVPSSDRSATIATADINTLQSLVAECTACDLSRSRNNTVFGSGNSQANWMFVGEAPGANEDRQGEAFVGRAGKLLDSMFFALGLTRDDVFIANVLKCRPPSNRDPMGEEVRQCQPYLHRQIDLVKPQVIVAMGRFAAQALLQSNDSIGALRGDKHAYRETGIPLIVTYHPAYLLRTPDQKSKVWQDLVFARRVINGS